MFEFKKSGEVYIDKERCFLITQSNVTSKLKNLFEHLEIILDTEENKKWYKLFIEKIYLNQDWDDIFQNLDKIYKFCENFLERNPFNISFDGFVNTRKKTKSSLVFDISEIKKLYLLSALLKLLFLITGTNLIKEKQEQLNRMLFQIILEKYEFLNIVKRIQEVIQRKLFRCIGMDYGIIKIIALKSTMTDYDFALFLFDYVLTVILIIYDLTRNPITFIVTSVDQIMNWHYAALYQKAVVYKETGELFGKTMGATNLPEKILSDMIYDYIQDIVTRRNKENGISQIDIDVSLDRDFYNFFILPLYHAIFKLKNISLDYYSNYQKVIIQLFIYYTLLDFVEKTGTNIFPLVEEKDIIKHNEGKYERYKLFEILKRLPCSAEKKEICALRKPIFEDEAFLISEEEENTTSFETDSNTGFFISNITYRLHSLDVLFSKNYTFYGINNLILLTSYMKVVFSSINDIIFKNIFVFDMTVKQEFKAKKFIKQLELEMIPFLMAIMGNNVPFFDSYREFVTKL